MTDPYEEGLPLVKLNLSNISPTARSNEGRIYYCTTEEVSAFAGGYGLESFACEDKIKFWLPFANDYIDGYTQRNFRLNSNEVEFRDGNNKDTLNTYNYPIVRINHVVLYNQLLQTMRVFLDTELIIDAPFGLIKLPPIYPAFMADVPHRAVFGNIFVAGSRNIEVNYDWGYEQTPGDIKMAAIKYIMVQLMQGKDAQNHRGLRSISFDGVSESYGGYADIIKSFQDEIKETLDRHKRYSGFTRSI